MTTRLTVREANAILRDSGAIINVVLETGEYRVSDRFTVMSAAFPDESRDQIRNRIELRAYYATDLDDAVNTARHFRPSLTQAMEA